MSREEEQLENRSAASEPTGTDAGTAGATTGDTDAAGSLESEDDSNDFQGADAEEDDEDDEVIIYDADAEDAAEKLDAMRREMADKDDEAEAGGEVAPGGSRSMSELISLIESLIFVSEEPLQAKTLSEV